MNRRAWRNRPDCVSQNAKAKCGGDGRRRLVEADTRTHRTLSAQFWTAYAHELDTNWTPKPSNWADKGYYHRTLSTEFWRSLAPRRELEVPSIDSRMMLGFLQWLTLREQFDPAAYDQLFDQQLEALLARMPDGEQRERAATTQGFAWTNYIAACLRNAGFRYQGDLEERIHDVAVKLLVSPGGLFRDYDERRHGPLDLRFKRSVGNAIRNIVALERSRRKYIPAVCGGTRAEDLPARPEANYDTTLIERFRQLLAQHGRLALAVFDTRLNGEQTKDLIGHPQLGNPGKFQIKRAVQQVKAAAREFAEASGDQAFLRQVERLMAAETATIQKRQAATRQRQVAAMR